MANVTGNDSDNRLRGTSVADTIQGKNGTDILEGLGGADKLLGGKDDDYLFGGLGNDILSGDGDTPTDPKSQYETGSDVLVGGLGSDILYAWGDDILVGGGSNQYNSQLIDFLKNDPFTTPSLVTPDNQKDTFVAVNKDGVGYTLTIVDYELGIDQIDLRSFGVINVSGFSEIQDKGSYFEAKTFEFNGAELVLRTNVDPSSLTYVV